MTGLTGNRATVLLVKRKYHNLYLICKDFWILNGKLFKINHAFPLDTEYIQAIGQSNCEVSSVVDI